MVGIDTFQGAAAVTPNDSTDLPDAAQALYVGGAGNVKVTTADGNEVTINSVAAGATLHLKVTRVHATGTTATNITALY